MFFQVKITRLPAYLTIQFVRFYYKEKEAINAKILKDVKFTLDFDAYELCSPELQNKLTPMRERFKQYEDSLVEESCNAKETKDKESTTKKKKQEPYWFKNGNEIWKRYYIDKYIFTSKSILYLSSVFFLKTLQISDRTTAVTTNCKRF